MDSGGLLSSFETDVVHDGCRWCGDLRPTMKGSFSRGESGMRIAKSSFFLSDMVIDGWAKVRERATWREGAATQGRMPDRGNCWWDTNSGVDNYGDAARPCLRSEYGLSICRLNPTRVITNVGLKSSHYFTSGTLNTYLLKVKVILTYFTTFSVTTLLKFNDF